MLKKFSIYFFLYALTIWIVLAVFFLVPFEHNRFPLIRLVIIIFATVLITKYFIYMFVSPWNDVLISFQRYRRRKLPTKKRRHEPKVSVLVPAWNEELGIITTIEALLQSTYKNTEIIVINNASTDNTEKNVKALIRKRKRSLRADIVPPYVDIVYLREDKQGKGYALNSGIAAAKGDIIMSIDADCFVPPETIRNFVNYFNDPEVMAAVGNVKIGNTKTIIGVIQYLEFLFSFYFKKADSILGSIYIIGGAAGAFRKEVFRKLGGYSVSNITEDIDLSMRIQFSGMKIVYAQDAIVYTEGADDFGGLIKQRIRWKRGRLETFIKYRNLFFSADKKHNKFLSWIVLPLAIFGDMQLFLELFFIVFLFVYSYLTSDYSSFISGIIVVSSMFVVQIASDINKKTFGNLLFLAPIGWVLLYASTFVEFRALIKTFSSYLIGEEVKWQKWDRKGVFNQDDADHRDLKLKEN